MNLFWSDANPWVTALAGSAVLGLNFLFLFGGYAAVMRRRTGRRVPEGEWRIWTKMYSAPDIRMYLIDSGEGGWHAYRLQLWWDIVYSVLLGFAGVVLLDGLFGRYFAVDRWWLVLLVLSPALAASADALEDAWLLRAVGPSAPGQDVVLPDPVAVDVARWFTRAKWVLYAASFVVLVVSAIRLIQVGT